MRIMRARVAESEVFGGSLRRIPKISRCGSRIFLSDSHSRSPIESLYSSRS